MEQADKTATQFVEALHELFDNQVPAVNALEAVFLTDGVYSYRCSFRGDPLVHEIVLASDDLS